MVFIKAAVGPPLIGDPNSKFTVQYFDEHGNMIIRSRGSRAWRCNNPGNLLATSYSTGKDRRAIGTATDSINTYAVYPDYETGHKALIIMIKGSVYSPLTLQEAMARYDGSNANYINEIKKITHLDPERTIKSLTPKEFEMFWKAIEHVEKWEIGNEEFIEKWIISGVHKKRGVVTEYLITTSADQFWLSKKEAINFAIEGKLHAIVVHLKNRPAYLRPEFGTKPFDLVT